LQALAVGDPNYGHHKPTIQTSELASYLEARRIFHPFFVVDQLPSIQTVITLAGGVIVRSILLACVEQVVSRLVLTPTGNNDTKAR
jgi:hypothetical protein